MQAGSRWTWSTLLDVRPSEIQSVMSEAWSGTFAGMLSAVVITLSIWTTENALFLTWWLIYSVLVFSYLAYAAYRGRGYHPKKVSNKVARRFVFYAVLYASPWVVLAYATLMSENIDHIFLVMMLCAAMSVGGGLVLYRFPLASFTYAGFIIVSANIAFILRDVSQLWPPLLYSIIYFALIGSVTLKYWKIAREWEDSLEQASLVNIELQKANEEISRLAEIDVLTGLYNREVFIKALDQWARSQVVSRFAVLLLDLDRFKNINDTFGHDAGDELLVAIAERLSGVVTEPDIISRLGGDEFAILVDMSSDDDRAEDLAERVIEVLNQPVKIQNVVVNPNASIGIALCSEQTNDISDYVRLADTALRAAKENGRGRYEIYTREMAFSTAKMDEIEESILEALENNGFDVFYQPIFSLETNEFISAEVALKWSYTDQSVGATRALFEVAEMRGLLPRISAHQMDIMIRDMRYFGENLDAMFPMSINIHSLDLKAPEMVTDRLHTLVDLGCQADSITFEVSESILIERGADQMRVALDVFDDLGVKISLDNFGAGQAALSNIRGLPISDIKFHSKMIQSLASDPDSYELAVLKAMLEFANCLGIRCTVTGLSSPELVEFLKEVNPLGDKLCVQGRLWSSPMIAEDFVSFYHEHIGEGRKLNTAKS